MIATAHLARPLQRRCAQCRRVQEVRLPALYHVVVPNKGGGTRRDGGYDCRFCGTENPIPAAEMPLGLVASLPSRDEQRAAAAAAAAAKAVVSAPAVAPLPIEPPPSLPPSPDPAHRRSPAKRTAPPAWVTGPEARSLLEKAVTRAGNAPDGFCTAFLRDAAGTLAPIDVRDRIEAGAILPWLDRDGCELLVLGGTDPDGARWKAVFHPFAGAATLAIEPGDR